MLDHELRTACRLAREAGAAIEGVREAGFEAVTKDDETPVTRADIAADEILTEGLTAAFPSDGLLSEESGHRGGASNRTWIIDPLDGTKGFIGGVEGYAVQVGLVDGDTPVLGVVFEPHTGRLYHAVTGKGAFLLQGEGPTTRLSVSDRATYADMNMIASSSLGRARFEAIGEGLGLAGSRPIRSVGVKVGHIVRQAADIYVSSHSVMYWDSCAPLVILREAGGRWTHPDGGELTFDLGAEIPSHGAPFIVTNGPRHMDVMDVVASVMRWTR